MSEFCAVGKPVPRLDGIARVTGQEVYPSDVILPKMLYGTLLTSPYAHARIKSIDTSKAEKLRGVKAVITHKDIPQVLYATNAQTIPTVTVSDTMVLESKARHVGDRIAAVAAESEEIAQEAIELISVDYEPLPVLLDPVKAMESDAPQIHDYILLGNKKVKVERNLAAKVDISEGDIEKGFKEADLIFEDEFKTGRPYHNQLETKGCVCRPEPDGGITVWPTAQSIHGNRQVLGGIFGIPLSKINVMRMPFGGAFGSSIHVNFIIPVCVALALKTRRPVKMFHSREEDMYYKCRYPATIKLKTGVKRDGTLKAGHMKVIVDNGAYHVWGYWVLGCMAGWWVSLYRLPHVKFEGVAAYTNTAAGVAFQGFGNPQVEFAVESQMDMIAEELGMDPIELRLKNYVRLGDTFWGQGPTVRSIIKSCGVEYMLEKGSKMIGWERRKELRKQTGTIRRGIGMARGFHTSGCGAPLPGEIYDYSSALVKINEDGTVDVVTPLADPGGGNLTVAAQIVAETLGVPVGNVGISPAGTSQTPYDVATHATRGVYCGGSAVKATAAKTREMLLEYASKILGAPPHALKIEPQETQGVISVEGVPEKSVTVGEVAKTAQINDWGTIMAVTSYRTVDCPPCFICYFLEVEVDMETGQIKPVRAVIGSDAGTVMNPPLAAGQLHAGLQKGLGYALVENTLYDNSGNLVNRFLTDYKMFSAADMPKVETFFTPTYEPTGPFGAKGIGESALNPVAAAVANAVYNATGVRFKEIPMTPERVLEALREKRRK